MSAPPWVTVEQDENHWSTRVDATLHSWLAHRACTVAAKTLRADQDLLRLIPAAYLCRDPRTITAADIDGILISMRARGLSELSVRRHRASLSRFFAWCAGRGVVESSPVGKDLSSPPVVPPEVRPFAADELESAWREWSDRDAVLADVMLVLARTGLRWGEARALTVGDAVEASWLNVDKTASEGVVPRQLPCHQVRHVPVVPRIVDIVDKQTYHREPDELLLTTSKGAQLHRTAVLRRLAWSDTGRGRRMHDLRHTAAYLWLGEGVDPSTVRTWMGPTRLADE